MQIFVNSVEKLDSPVYFAPPSTEATICLKCDASDRASSIEYLKLVICKVPAKYRHLVLTATLQMLVVALVHCRLDYRNSVLVGLSAYLQSVLCSRPSGLSSESSRVAITSLISLRWWRVTEEILYKMAVLTYKAVHGGSPRYLSSSLTCLVDEHSALSYLPFADSAVQTVNRRRSSVSNRSSTALEQAAGQCHVGQFVVGFPSATETHAVPAVIPRHYHLTFLNCSARSGPSSHIAT